MSRSRSLPERYQPQLLLVGITGLALLTPEVHARRAAMLPVDGVTAEARVLEQEMDHAARKHEHGELISPVGVRSHLGAVASVEQSLTAASALITESERAGVFMNRSVAISKAREAIDTLRRVYGRYHTPRLVARAHVAHALGLLLKPAAEAQAAEALRSALDAAPDYQPAKDRMAPEVQALLKQARRVWQAPRLPAPQHLKSVARALSAAHLLWFSVRVSSRDTLDLKGTVLDDQGHAVQSFSARGVRTSHLRHQAALIINQTLESLVGHAAAVHAAAPRSSPDTTSSPQPSSSLQPSPIPSPLPSPRPPPSPADGPRRVWTWVAAGGALASLVTGIALGSAAGSDHREWQDLLQAGTDYESWVALKQSGEQKSLGANIMFGVSAALALSALALFFFESRGAPVPKEADHDLSALKSSTRWLEVLSVSPAGISLRANY